MRNYSRKVPTETFWKAIISNAQAAMQHTNWIACLDNIKVLCAIIDERVDSFERRKRREGLARQHRTLDESLKEELIAYEP